MSWDVIVVGAGSNGLTAATLLAKAGRRVLVLERREVVGGLAAPEEFVSGYHTSGVLSDTATVRPGVVDALELERHGLKRDPNPAPIFTPHPDGGGLLLHHDPETAAQEIARVSDHDATAYRRFRGFIDQVRGVVEKVMNEPPPDFSSLGAKEKWSFLQTGWSLRRLGADTLRDVFRIGPMCVADWLNEWFETDLLKATLAGPAVYPSFTGPWSPGTAATLLIRESTLHGRIAGGAPALVAALERASRDAGVTIRTGVSVEKLLVSHGRVAGVRVEGGEEITASLVGASTDPRHALLDLVPARELPPSVEHEIRHFRGYGTVAKIDLALKGSLEFSGRSGEMFEFIHVAPDLDYLEKSFDAVKYDTLPESPSLEIHVPSIEQGDAAPAGCAVVSILARFIPYRLEGGWDQSARERLGDLVVRTLSRYSPTLPSQIVGHRVLAPPDLEERYGLVEGHPYQGDHTLDQLVLRPNPECARYRTPVEGLFLCGSGSHPGGGLTLAPGALAAGEILAG